jgi:hypothetical protein
MNDYMEVAAEDVVVTHFEAQHLELLLVKYLRNCSNMMWPNKDTELHICPTW